MSERFSNIRQMLIEYSESDFKKFTGKLTPGAENILGVRIPILRKMAKEIIKDNPIDFIENYECRVYEDKMLKGIVIGYVKIADADKIEYIRKFVPLIKDWSVCDITCNTFKLKEKQLETFFDFILEYKNSDSEFELRFMVVMFLNYYLVPEYIERVIEIIDSIQVEYYYTNMAIAWLVAEMFVRQRECAVEYIKHNKLNKFTINKAIQKSRESYRISDEDKKYMVQFRQP